MTNILNEIAVLLDDKRKPRLEGWASIPKAQAMAMAVYTLRPVLCVEIGVFAGRSLFPVAMTLKEIGKGQVMAIDPFSPAASGEGYTGVNKEWWEKTANHEYVYKQFQQTLNDTGTFKFVKFLRAKSDNVVPPDKIDFLHIDGQHTEQAVRDAERFASKVRVGGICVLDDLKAFDGHVDRAADRLRGLGFIELYQMGSAEAGGICGFYQRV